MISEQLLSTGKLNNICNISSLFTPALRFLSDNLHHLRKSSPGPFGSLVIVGCLDVVAVAVAIEVTICCWFFTELYLWFVEEGMEAVMDKCFCRATIGFSQGLLCCFVRRDVLIFVENEGLIVRDDRDDTEDHVFDLGVLVLLADISSSVWISRNVFFCIDADPQAEAAAHDGWGAY